MSKVRRQPQRAATLGKTYEDDGYLSEAQSEPSEAESVQDKTQPPKKKTRYSIVGTLTGTDSARRRRNLSKFLEMPLDVLYEIFIILHPKDILSLARTTQAFRETLRAPSAGSVWRVAMDRDGAPSCPSDWTRPRWAALLYDHHCQNCPANNIQRVDYYTRRRLCISCRKAVIVSKEKILNSIWASGDVRKIMDLTPNTLEPPIIKGGVAGRFWHYGDLAATDKTLAELEDDNEALVAWTAQRLNILDEIEELAEEWDAWKRRKDGMRRADDEILAQQRLQDIRNRLQALGYSTDDIAVIELRREVRRASPLTERYWKKIKGDLILQVEEARDARLRDEAARNWTPPMALPLLTFCLLVDYFSSR